MNSDTKPEVYVIPLGTALGDHVARIMDRFWSQVDRTDDPDACWPWKAPATGGYGQFSLDGKRPRPHRFIYELLVAPIPDGLVLDHLCNNPPCVNPRHLEPVTQAENMRRMSERQTRCRRAGHEYTEENTYRAPGSGKRQCRKCMKEPRR